MKKVNFLLPIITLVFLTIVSCKKEDDGIVTVVDTVNKRVVKR